MVHQLGAHLEDDVCVLQEDSQECFLELATTLDGAFVTINSNSKTSSEVRCQANSSIQHCYQRQSHLSIVLADLEQPTHSWSKRVYATSD